MDFQEQNEPKQFQEIPLDVEADFLDAIRNKVIAACLGILNYIAIKTPQFLYRQIVHLVPSLVKYAYKLATLGFVLFCLAVLLAWPYMYGILFDRPEVGMLAEILWLLAIGIPGAYFGLKSQKKWLKQWQDWRNRVKAAGHLKK